jgi:hypothetical protein
VYFLWSSSLSSSMFTMITFFLSMSHCDPMQKLKERL